jgi:DNA-binding NarL/FixJ family response regulator
LESDLTARTVLSDHEWFLLQALDTGASNKELGVIFGKSEYTIRNQLSALYKRIGAANRVHAVIWFRTHAPRSVPMTNRATADRRQNASTDRRKAKRPAA